MTREYFRKNSKTSAEWFTSYPLSKPWYLSPPPRPFKDCWNPVKKGGHRACVLLTKVSATLLNKLTLQRCFQATDLKVFLQRFHAQAKEEPPRLLFLPQFLANLVQTFVDVDAQAGQHLLLGNVQCLGVAVTAVPGQNQDKKGWCLIYLPYF